MRNWLSVGVLCRYHWGCARANLLDNLLLRYLRSIDSRLHGVARDISEIKASQAGMLQILASHDALVGLEDRLDQIEKHFGLTDGE